MLSYRPGPSLVTTRPLTSTDKYPFVRFVFWSVAPLSQKPCFTPLILSRGPQKAVRFMGYLFGSPVFLDLLPQQTNIHLSVSPFGLLLLFPKNLTSLRSFRFSGALFLIVARVRGNPVISTNIQKYRSMRCFLLIYIYRDFRGSFTINSVFSLVFTSTCPPSFYTVFLTKGSPSPVPFSLPALSPV